MFTLVTETSFLHVFVLTEVVSGLLKSDIKIPEIEHRRSKNDLRNMKSKH